ncbi:hypothetical protein EVAR_98422_1 [Eumeta japonica]|uniref:Uncharacterized protein n=1 Tax=Eumeta variegata TaxID=151549 RepID=A0A4C2ABP8_EUMVA|nr:hypothetical protein EVAR_98422_1 [Eumeta japonica]
MGCGEACLYLRSDPSAASSFEIKAPMTPPIPGPWCQSQAFCLAQRSCESPPSLPDNADTICDIGFNAGIP